MRLYICVMLAAATIWIGMATYGQYHMTTDECWHGRTIGSFQPCGDTLLAMSLRRKG